MALLIYFYRHHTLMCVILSSLLLYPSTCTALDKTLEKGSNESIVLSINNWSSQRTMTRINAELLRKMGYSVKIQPTKMHSQWTAINAGNLHVQVEAWEGTMAESPEKLLNSTGIEDMGNHSTNSYEGWWYPAYVEKLCPGLPDWRALNDCAHLFADEHISPKGLYFRVGWDSKDQKRMMALKLDYIQVNLFTEAALWQELESALRQEKPIMLFNWSPNWVGQVHAGNFVRFPNYNVLCHRQPSWGVNSEETYDCGNPRSAWVKKIAWSGLQEKWPCAHNMLKKMAFTKDMIAELAYWDNVEGITEKAAVKRWLSKYQSLWNNWISPECQPKS